MQIMWMVLERLGENDICWGNRDTKKKWRSEIKRRYSGGFTSFAIDVTVGFCNCVYCGWGLSK
jgi:hypothetical protein